MKRKAPASKKRKSTRKKSGGRNKAYALKAKGKQKKKSRLAAILQPQNIFFILFVILCASFLFQIKTHQVDGQSMEPTFQNRDRIFVNRTKKIKRYEIITFDPRSNEADSYVKRVIGVPGDRIWVKENSVFLLPKESNLEGLGDIPQLSIQLPDSVIKIDVSAGVAGQMARYTEIPENNYFVQGDNRNHSTDSRTLGLINSEQIEGVVVYRYYPFFKAGIVH
ncbi:signal peptidase I [Enterococcus termitis]|uniref:Signal peptidase I n=1 Tax=Enterococcus termitis TaxID=332950 RepID=A0A1E5GW57_9ENTE|nr:signal peptidase I [Enterococcus termitis]